MSCSAALGAETRIGYRNERIVASRRCDSSTGRVRWRPGKSAWYVGMLVGWVVGGTVYYSWQAVAVFFAFCAVTLCFGHSLGMHRLLIHRSFACPAWMEKVGVYLGTLVGLGGPFTMMWTHDLRDWAQRQRHCHPFFGHRASLWRDWYWQLHCQVELDNPPAFRFPTELVDSRFYRFLERTAPLQQVPWALLFFALGGWGWVAWGVCGRVATCMTGHWLIGHFAHHPRVRHRVPWRVRGAAVQGFNVPYCGLLTFGECWHNNHHAFPGSARLGFGRHQADPGWWVLTALAHVGLVWNVRLPADLPPRPELKRESAAAAPDAVVAARVGYNRAPEPAREGTWFGNRRSTSSIGGGRSPSRWAARLASPRSGSGAS